MLALKDLDRRLDEWRDAGLIDERQLHAIETYEEGHHPEEPVEVRRIPVIAEAVGYLGAALASAAVMFFAIDQWNTWSDVTRMLIVAAGTVAAFAVGWFTRGSVEPAIQRFSAVMWTATMGGTLATMFILTSDVLEWDDPFGGQISGAVLITVATGLYLLRRHMLMQLGMLAGVLVTILPRFDSWNDPELWIGGTLAAVGIAWFALGWREILTPGRGARIAGAIVAFFGTMQIYDGTDGRTWVLLVAALMAMALVGLSIVLRQPELTFLGGVFTFQSTLIWVNETFAGTLGVPVALLVAGTLAIGAALVLTRRMRGGPHAHA